MNLNWQTYRYIWQALFYYCYFAGTRWVFLLLDICSSSISARRVRPSPQSVEEPSDSWEKEHCINFLMQRYTSFLPSLKREDDPERWRMEALRSCVQTKSGSVTASSSWARSCPTSAAPVMKDWGGVVAVSSQEADNQITQDYVSHLTCMDPVSVLRSVIQATEEFIFLSVSERRRKSEQERDK